MSFAFVNKFIPGQDKESEDEHGKFKGKKEAAAATLTSLLDMFQFASKRDVFILMAGVLATVAHSICFPVMALLLGNISQTFTAQPSYDNITNSSNLHVRADDSGVIHGKDLHAVNHTTHHQKHHEHEHHHKGGGSDSPFAMMAQVFAYFGKVLGLYSESNPMTREEFSVYAQTLSLYFVGFGILVFISSYFQTVCFEVAAENQVHQIRIVFVRQLLRQELSWFEKRSAGYLITKLADDVERVREGIGHKFSLMLEYCFSFLFCAFFGLCVNWKLTFIFGISVPFIITKILYLLRVFAEKAVHRQERYAKVGAVCEEVLPLVKTLAVFGTELDEGQKFEKELAANYDKAVKDFQTIGVGTGGLYVLVYVAFGVATLYASNQLLHQQISKRQVFTVFSCMSVGIVALSNILPLITEIAYSHGCTKSIMKIIGSKPTIDPYAKAGRKPFNFAGKVRLSHVTFSHKSRKDLPVLRDINLMVPAGSTIALVGPTGEGKSTIADLVLRFYDPQDGTITLDDFDLRHLNLKWLRENVGIVTSHSEFMTDSIYENIRGGLDGVYEDDVVRAAKAACAHDFILKLPEGYRTMIGISDRELTGWQKQLLAIARVLVKKQKVLILDEAYSNVHLTTVKKLIKQLVHETTDKTTIVISNSISRIHMINMIYVINRGEIVESGSHAELMSKGGVYFQLSLDEDMEALARGAEPVEPETKDEEDASDEEEDEDDMDTRDMHRSDSEECAFSEVSEDFGKPDYSMPMIFNRTIKDEIKDLFVKNPIIFAFSVVGFLGCVITGLVPPLFALVYSQLFISFAESGAKLTADTAYWSKFVFLSGFVCGIGFCLRTILAGALGENLARFMREDTYHSIIRKSLAWFESEDHSPEKLHALISRGIPIFKHAIGMRLGGVISGFVSLVTTTIVALVLQWQLAIVIITEAGVHFYILHRLKWSHESVDDGIEAIMAKANSVVGEAVQNIRTIKTLGLEEEIVRQFSFVMECAEQFLKPHAKCVGIALACSHALTCVSFGVIFFVGAVLIDHDDMVPINLFKVFIVLSFSTFAVGQITSFVPDYMRATSAYANLVNLKEPEMLKDLGHAPHSGLTPEINGVVEFSNVTYSDDNIAEEPVLEDVSFRVEPGHCLGIIGGENNTTLMSIILGFHEPESGTVSIDGIDLKTLDIRHVRHSIGYVAYTRLFHRSIKENMLYGYKGKKLDEEETISLLNATAEAVALQKFIQGLPEGYETNVGSQGTCLTAGQTQRILIARAIIRDPRILLLEEPTSCLDAHVEAAVLSSLQKIIEGRTCIISSKEPSVIKLADSIIVLKHGRVLESGTPEELDALRGEYYHFMRTK